MSYDENMQTRILQKLYLAKCDQLEQARVAGKNLRYEVLKAEADAIRLALPITEGLVEPPLAS